MKIIFPTIYLCCLLSISCSNATDNRALKVAILDTSFCVKQLQTAVNNNIKIMNEMSFYERLSKDDACKTINSDNPRYHGHYVLETFLSNLKTSQTIELYPINVFNENGDQHLEIWQRALTYLSEINPDVVIMASAYIDEKNPELPIIKDALYLVAAGTKKPFFNDKTFLWPQFTDHKNMLRVGHIFGPSQVAFSPQTAIVGHYDTSLYDFKKIDYFIRIPAGHKNILGGSSFAVAKLSAAAVSHCGGQIGNRSIENLKKCVNLMTLVGKTSDSKSVTIIKE